jgi:hypothetical protein
MGETLTSSSNYIYPCCEHLYFDCQTSSQEETTSLRLPLFLRPATHPSPFWYGFPHRVNTASPLLRQTWPIRKGTPHSRCVGWSPIWWRRFAVFIFEYATLTLGLSSFRKAMPVPFDPPRLWIASRSSFPVERKCVASNNGGTSNESIGVVVVHVSLIGQELVGTLIYGTVLIQILQCLVTATQPLLAPSDEKR